MDDNEPQAYHLPVPSSGTLVVLRHYHLDVVDAAIAAFEQLTEANENKAAKLKDWLRRFEFFVEVDETHNVRSPRAAESLRQLDDSPCVQSQSNDTTLCLKDGIKIISDTFFLGAVGDVPFTWNNDMSEEGNTRHYGAKVRVEIRFLQKKPRKALHISLLETVLHEFVHVILGKFTCGGYFCAEENCEVSKCFEIGMDGCEHGLAFQKLAKAVEKESERFFGVKLDLDGKRGARGEEVFLTPSTIKRFFEGVDPRTGTRVQSSPPTHR